MRKTTAALLASILLLIGACGSDDGNDDEATSTTAADDEHPVLGTRDPAEGEAVKVGLISNGAGQGFDTTIDEGVAQAAVGWINAYRGGIGGRPIELVVCTDRNDPAGAADCATEMVQQDVVAVVYGANGQFEASWRPLHEAGIPTFILISGGSEEAAADETNTFLITDSRAPTVDGPIALAEELGADKVSVVAVDVPAATSVFREGGGPEAFEAAGLDLHLLPVALGTPDMTPEMIRLVERNPDGVVLILGTDAFCLAALDGLQTAGFEGSIAANESCVGDATRASGPPELLEGIRTHVGVPLADKESESYRLYQTVLEEFGPDDVDRDEANGAFAFLATVALDVATAGLDDEVTAETVTDAAKSMEWSELPGSGGRHFRCNGKADPDQPAVCSSAVLYAVLDSKGLPTGYEVVGDEEIPD